MDGEAFKLCGRLPDDFSAPAVDPARSAEELQQEIDQFGPLYFEPKCTRVHEIAIERNIVARHLRFLRACHACAMRVPFSAVLTTCTTL